MPDDPRKSWLMVQPGCYIDLTGAGHIFPFEIIAHLQHEFPEAGFEFTRDDYDMVVGTYVNLLRIAVPWIEIRIVEHDPREMN